MTRNEFRQHLPALTAACAEYGPAIAYANRTVSEAAAAIWADAIQRGASGLSERDRLDLDRWITATLAKSADVWMPAAQAVEESGDRSFERVISYMRDWLAAHEGDVS
jgi:hypothetical protein